MTNSSTPCSKSSIACFKQLNPGDYLVVKEDRLTPNHHGLVVEVCSPTVCSVVEVWNGRVRQNTFELKTCERSYYRLNYNTDAGVCRPVDKSITHAKSILQRYFHFKYSRRTFVNYLKTGEDSHKVDVNLLKDDRILLPRKKVESARELKPGDHIERPFATFLGQMGYYHNMLVLKVLDEKKCEVLHCSRKEVVDIFESNAVSLVKYTERIDPEEGISQLLKLATSDSQVGYTSTMLKQDYNHYSNSYKHIIMIGTIGTPIDIQVDAQLYQELHESMHQLSPGLADACIRATFNAAIHTSFRVGNSAALTATGVGLVSGVALGTNIRIETPFLVRSIYKTNRKNKFEQISSTEAKRQIAISSITSANTVLGGTAGAIVGQLAIPVPVFGAAVGGFCGVVAGRVLGNLEGRGVAQLLSEKNTDLPVFLHSSYVPTPSLH